ncbi:MAG: ParB/RepB/Spo0J family partition protein [Actinobacteria bacterium]|nr:ParB/RepB/Spo0J family partition protein [Actinomycetota bacterium]
MPTTEIRTPEVDIDKIDPGSNARQHFDEAGLAQLAKTIEVDGVVQPLRVRQKEKGRFELVAGERRWRAAKIAGRKKVPVALSTGSPRAEAFIENHHRVDLNPIETARDLKAFAEEFGLTSNTQIAARAGKTKAWVGERLRLLELPEEVQRYIGAGDVPISAEPKLRKIAAVSPEIAALICEVAKRSEVSGNAFNERFGELFSAAGEAEVKNGPTMISIRGFQLSEVVKDKAKRSQLVERINAVEPSYRQHQDPTIRFGEAEVDAARAHGCLVEYQSDRRRYSTTYGHVTDIAFAADLVERALECREKEIAARARAEEEEKAKRKDEQKKIREQQKQIGEETPQARKRKRRAIARSFNDALKRALLKKRTAARRKKYALARSRAVAVQLISDNPKLAGRGLRLVSDQLQDLEVKPLKNGGRREKVTYADEAQSTTELLRRALGTNDPLEVIEVLAEALLAGILTDAEEVPNGDYIGWRTPVAGEIEKLLATEIKEVRPHRTRKPE